MDYNFIQYLNKILGHSDIETTLRYIGYYEYSDEDGSNSDNND